jgi:hypothetical protein
MTEPTDKILYDKVVAEVNKSYKKPSAYRSMGYAKYYKKAFEEKYGTKKSAYKGKNPEELKTWRKEKWVDVKSVLKDPKNPTACGNEPYGKGEYPLCMKEKELKKYTKGELELLKDRKNQLGKKRLVKDAFLRDVLEPEKTPPARIYKQKYVPKKERIPEPLPEKEATKILNEKPIREKRIREKVQRVTIPTTEDLKPAKPRGRPKLSAEQLALNKQATLERRRVARQEVKKANAEKRAQEKATRNAEKEAAQQMIKQNRPERVLRYRDNEPADSPHNTEVARQKAIKLGYTPNY